MQDFIFRSNGNYLNLPWFGIFYRRKFCICGRPSVSNKESPYAEIGNQPSGASTYQELTVPGTNKDYQNLALQ